MKQKDKKLLERPYDASRIAKEPFPVTPNDFLCLSVKGQVANPFSSKDEVRNFFKKFHSCSDLRIEVLDFKRVLWMKVNFEYIHSAQAFENKLLRDEWFQSNDLSARRENYQHFFLQFENPAEKVRQSSFPFAYSAKDLRGLSYHPGYKFTAPFNFSKSKPFKM